MQNENLKQTERLLDSLQVIPLDQSFSKKVAEISAKLGALGELIDYREAMMAAISIENDLTLLTRNKLHFSRIKNLKLVSWWKNKQKSTIKKLGWFRFYLKLRHINTLNS
jgi:predicted nucleic acid-binding protein